MKVNPNEAPEGFYAILKSDVITNNVCESCDARKLCCDNLDNWCTKNPCMSYPMLNIRAAGRKDNCSVIFKLINKLPMNDPTNKLREIYNPDSNPAVERLLTDMFNCFSNDTLKDFVEFAETEYDISNDDKDDEES